MAVDIPQRFRNRATFPPRLYSVRFPPAPRSLDPEIERYFASIEREINSVLSQIHGETLLGSRVLNEWADDLPYMKVGGVNLADDQVSATNSIKTWDAAQTVLSSPYIGSVIVIAWVAGTTRNNHATNQFVMETFVEISLNGGTTWTGSGKRSRNDIANAGGTPDRMSTGMFHSASGVPSGDVMVRARIQQIFGGAGNGRWEDGFLGWIVSTTD